MLSAQKFFKKDFVGTDMQNAYFTASRWIAKNVVNKQSENPDIFWNLTKLDKETATIRLTLYTMLPIDEQTNRFCELCKDMHKAFFVNENFNCDRCNMVTYKNRLEERIRIKAQFKKERLHYILDKKL